MCACPRTEERQHTGSLAVLQPARVRICARVRGCAHARCVCARSCTPAFRGSATLWLRPRSVISLTDDPRIRDPTYGRSYQKRIPRLTVVLRVIICSASAARPPLPQHCRRFVRPCGMACVTWARVVWHAFRAPVWYGMRYVRRCGMACVTCARCGRCAPTHSQTPRTRAAVLQHTGAHRPRTASRHCPPTCRYAWNSQSAFPAHPIAVKCIEALY